MTPIVFDMSAVSPEQIDRAATPGPRAVGAHALRRLPGGAVNRRVGQAERRGVQAERRPGQAERRLGQAERRGGQAERRVGQAKRRLELADRRVQRPSTCQYAS